jgi:hypothetical protein
MARGSDPVLSHAAVSSDAADSEFEEVDDANLDVGDTTEPELDLSNLTVGDATEVISRKVAFRRRLPRTPWLAGAIAAFAIAGGISLAAPPATSRAEPGVFAAEAAWIASAIDASARSARIRVYSVASLPMIQGAVLTDAATVQDLITSEMDLPVHEGETLELDQVSGTTRSALLRWPATAPAIAPIGADEMRVERDARGGLSLVFAARVTPYNDRSKDQPITGVITLSSPIDLAPVQQRLANVAVDVTLTGAGEPITLVDGAGDAGPRVDVPVGTLTMTATPRVVGPAWKTPLLYSFCGLGIALLAVFVIRRRAG